MEGALDGEGSAAVAGKEAADSKPTSTRKRRNRSAGSESEDSSEHPDIEHVSKKMSISDMAGPPASQRNVDRVALLDAGAQYGKVIDRRVRELNVECVLFPLNVSAASLKEKGFKAVIITGSPHGVNDRRPLSYDPGLFSCDIPVLGICYGLQLIVKEFGGVVTCDGAREDGQFSIEVDTDCPLFSGLESKQSVLLTHGDSMEKVGEEVEVVGKSGNIIAAVQHKYRQIYGVQFHPEVDLTVQGTTMLKNFLYSVCGCSGNFTLQSREDICLEYIRKKVGRSKVLSLVSGGVDSAVCTALLNLALGPGNVVALHIDNGFMRKEESKHVRTSLEAMGLNPHVVNAAVRFYTSSAMVTGFDEEGMLQQQMTAPLHAVTNPEEKRKIIGDTFIKVADEALVDLDLQANDIFLAQGTLRPDLIESASSLASSNAQVIKTHHNDTQLVRELRDLGRVVEPLVDFHKDEVRVLGETLGLPKELVHRHPFPGPGLAIRVICQSDPFIQQDFVNTNSVLHLLISFQQSYHAAAPGIKELLQLLSAPEQETLFRISDNQHLHATLLPIRTVGVQGDGRTYSYVAAISSGVSDFCWQDIMDLAKIIPRICRNINRVAWVFGPPVVGPIEDITPTYLTRGVLETLRECDHLANQILREHDVVDHVSQMPVVLLPLHFDRDPACRPLSPRASAQWSSVPSSPPTS